MTDEKHFQSLGKLLGNYHTLEFVLRVFLYHQPGATSTGVPHGTDIYSFPVGTELDSCAITNFDSLGELIDKYNAEMQRRHLLKIDRTLVEIRDALAHGRVSASAQDFPLRLLKFSRPHDQRVRIVFNEEMSEVWFETQTKRVFEATQSVLTALPRAAVSL